MIASIMDDSTLIFLSHSLPIRLKYVPLLLRLNMFFKKTESFRVTQLLLKDMLIAF